MPRRRLLSGSGVQEEEVAEEVDLEPEQGCHSMRYSLPVKRSREHIDILVRGPGPSSCSVGTPYKSRL
jgi:hypothetical protein